MRKGIKKAVALFCAVVLTATSITLWNAPANAEAADTTTEPTPVKLEGYKNITASSFLDGSGNPMEDKAYSNGVKSYSLGQGLDGFDKTLLSLKLSFDKAADINDEVNSRIQVAGNKDDLGIMIYPSYTGSSLRIVFMEGMTNKKHTLNVYDSQITEKRFLGEFLLQMSFDYIDPDSDGIKDTVRLGVYVNGSKVDLVDGSLKPTSSDIPNCNIDTAFGKLLTTYCGSRSVTIKSVPLEDTEIPKDDWNLKNGSYSLTSFGSEDIYVNGFLTEKRDLNVPGVYEVAVGNSTNTEVIVVLFSPGHAHTDTAGSLDTRDLVATLKIQSQMPIMLDNEAARKGADFNGDTNVDDIDVNLLRNELLK